MFSHHLDLREAPAVHISLWYSSGREDDRLQRQGYESVKVSTNTQPLNEEDGRSLRPGDRILIGALLVFFCVEAMLTYAFEMGLFLSSPIDRDVALEMLKSIVEVDGFLIGFGGILATLAVGEAWSPLVALMRRVWALYFLFASALFFLASILSSLAAMSSLHDNVPAGSMIFLLPLFFLVGGVCLLCIVAGGAAIRPP
jgi:hypothetical protein